MGDRLPIVDLHCDLLCYLAEVPGAHPEADEAIGCSLPQLRRGNVCLQVMALFHWDPNSSESVLRQTEWFHRLHREYSGTVTRVKNAADLQAARHSGKTGIVAAIESLSTICTREEPLARGFDRFERLLESLGPLAYVSLTHSPENRFGGGDATGVGLKKDGREFLRLIDQRKIPLDLSHASEPLARDILEEIDRRALQIPVLASHSNFRRIWEIPRNLRDDLAGEIIRRQGLIGLNLVRGMLHGQDPRALSRHFRHGLDLGGKQALCFGADFFCEAQHSDPTRAPFFFPEQANAARYPQILEDLAADFVAEACRGFAHANSLRFFQQLWEQ